jgi:hypothetical protein
MDELLKEIEERLKQLKIGLEKQTANMYAQQGAIQECERWIKKIKEKSKTDV